MTDDEVLKRAEQIMARRSNPPKFCVDYSRDELIGICDQAIVPQKLWHNRDSCAAQQQVGRCRALLLAGCEFYIRKYGDRCVTDDRLIWVEINSKGFEHFDSGGDLNCETFYLPTLKAIEESKGRDWY